MVDKQKTTPLSYAMVTVKDKASGTILKHTPTTTDGTFRLSIDRETALKSNLHVALMGYREEIRKITDKGEQIFTIELEMSEVKLKEVVIKARKIWERGDTLVYNVGSFATAQDRSIGDVIKKMPGFDVKKDGEIFYNGKSINKFYIEGKDLLEGKYGIATNGVPQVEVGSIEVMENHQPIKALDGFLMSEKAAINLKMKDKSKAKWITTFDAGAGIMQTPKYPTWAVNAFGMILKSNLQNISTIKSNNIGKNYLEELRDFYNTYATVSGNFFSPRSSYTPNLEEERVLFNNSHLFSTNMLWSVGKQAELKIQFHYLNHSEDWDYRLSTTYFLPTGNSVIQESEDGNIHSHLLATVATYESNTPSSYLRNSLKADVKWADAQTHTLGSLANTQYADMPVYKVNNSLQWVKRLTKKAITVSSVNEFTANPHYLSVVSNNTNYSQRANWKTFYTYQGVSLGWNIKNTVINAKIGMEGQSQDLQSSLDGISSMPWSFVNDTQNGYVRLFASPELQYGKNRWKILLSSPLNYYIYHFSSPDDWLSDVKLSPSLSVYWNYSGNLTYYFIYKMNARPYDLANRFNGLMLRNYRTMRLGNNEYATGYQNSVSVGYDYKNISSGWFSNAIVSYLKNSNPFRESQQFYENFRIYSSLRQPTTSQTFLCNFGISKTIDFIGGMAGVDVSYMNTRSLLMSENTPTSYQSDYLITGLNINGEISSHLNWIYRPSYSAHALKIAHLQTNLLDGWQHSLMINIKPSKKLVWQVSGEYYRNEIMDNQYKNLIMLNSKIMYPLSKRVELSLNLHNLLNHTKYDFVTYNSLSEINQSYTIRGREVWFGFSWK